MIRSLNFYACSALLALSGCFSPSIETLEAIARRHNAQLEELAERSAATSVEHGGLIIEREGNTEFIEVENKFYRDRDRFNSYVEGDSAQLEILLDHINTAVSVRGNCTPSMRGAYHLQASNLREHLRCLLSNHDPALAAVTWAKYDELVMHHVYSPIPSQDDRACASGTVLLRVHTHPSREHIPPSLQDLDNSYEHDNLIVAIDENQTVQIYLARDGKTYTFPTPEQVLARAP